MVRRLKDKDKPSWNLSLTGKEDYSGPAPEIIPVEEDEEDEEDEEGVRELATAFLAQFNAEESEEDGEDSDGDASDSEEEEEEGDGESEEGEGADATSSEEDDGDASDSEEEEEEGEEDDFQKPYWFDQVVQLLRQGKNALLQGPSGCGKTHSGPYLAKELGVPFGMESVSESSTDSSLVGNLLPVSEGRFVFVESPFLSMCQNPGLFLWDEIDAGDPNWLVRFNTALAQRELVVPQRRLETLLPEYLEPIFSKHGVEDLASLRKKVGIQEYRKINNSVSTVKFHKNFSVLAAANTFGNGSDAVFSARNVLDGATLDRFRIGTFKLDYDPKVEERILEFPVLNWGRIMRRALKAMRSDHFISTRFLKDASDMVREEGWGQKDWEDRYFASWEENEVNSVRSQFQRTLVQMAEEGSLV